jgi:primary-amine oxidase
MKRKTILRASFASLPAPRLRQTGLRLCDEKNTVTGWPLLTGGLIMILFTLGCSEKKSSEPKGSTPVQSSFQHPLNPLSIEEIRLVKQILLAERKVDTTFRFHVINLNEPPKAEMLKYKSGDAFRREAFAVLYDRPNNKTYEAVVDLAAKKVLSFNSLPGVTAGGFAEDSVTDVILKKDPLWLAGLQKRGIHPDSVKTSFVFAGEMGIAPPDHREMICTPQYINNKYHELLIDGLVAYVDLTAQKVLKVLDDGGKTFYKPEDIGYFEIDSAKLLVPESKPLRITQPEGTSFTIEGFQVKGKSWSFRLGMDNREGLILHDVKYNDNGLLRPVLYRASVAEMYVPYGSTDLTHAAWNYYDVGAYRLGQSYIHSMGGLKVGADVPENSTFLSGIFHDERGEPKQVDSVVAVYEEYTGPLTRHGKFAKGDRNLVVKYFTKVWNYDYGFKWVFHEDGTIDLKMELTGVVGIKGVNRITDLPGGADETYKGMYYGTLVAPHVEATNHQHFFTFRLDMDVDGPENIVEEMNTVAVPANDKNPWNNAFVKQMSLIKNESEGQRNLNAGTYRHWMVADSKAVNALGQQKSYALMPAQNASPLAAAGSGPRRMADFLESQLWVTSYKENESYPAGDYPNSRGIKDGLPGWVEDNESLQGKDVVLWYNLGVTHIVRAEDWPIMNVHTIGFSLMPFGFFEKNPVIGNRRVPARSVIVPGKLMPPDVTLCVPLPRER